MSSTKVKHRMLERPIWAPPDGKLAFISPVDAEHKIPAQTEPWWTILLTRNSSVMPAGVLTVMLLSELSDLIRLNTSLFIPSL